MLNHPKPDMNKPAVSSYVLLAAALFVFIQAFALLLPILLSFLLIVLNSLAVNPVISRLRSLTGGVKGATGLAAVVLLVVLGLTGWAFFRPMKASVTKLVEKSPAYWERLQKPLIKMEQQAVQSEEKLQKEVTTEIAKENHHDTDHHATHWKICARLGGGNVAPPNHRCPNPTMNRNPLGPVWGMLTIGLLVFLLMGPIFGFMDALVLGLIAGVLEAVPFLGPMLSALPALLLAVGKRGYDTAGRRSKKASPTPGCVDLRGIRRIHRATWRSPIASPASKRSTLVLST